MWINHKLVDFSNAAKRFRVTPGAFGEEEADEAEKEPSEINAANEDNIEDSLQHEDVVQDPSGEKLNLNSF